MHLFCCLPLTNPTQDLTKSKSTIATLEETVSSSAVSLAAAQEALATAEASHPTPSADPSLQARLTALEKELLVANSELAEAKTALSRTQEDAANQFDAIGKMHEQEAMSKEEDHVQTVSNVKKELAATKEAYAVELASLKEQLVLADEEKERALKVVAAGSKAPQSPTGADELSHLHAAHSAKLSQVEAEARQEIDALEMVRLSVLLNGSLADDLRLLQELAKTKQELDLYRQQDE